MNIMEKWEMINKLFASTSSAKVQWEKTTDHDSFQARVKNYLIIVSKWGPEEDPDCGLRIEDSSGDTIESILWSDLKDLRISSGDPGQWVLYKLHEAARRNAMGADKAIREISGALDDL